MTCPHLIKNSIPNNSKFDSFKNKSIIVTYHCRVATDLAQLPCFPSQQECKECTGHPTSPQRINGITCGLAYRTQKESGLEPDQKLFTCIQTEQTFPPDVLMFLRRKWKELHTYKITPWYPDIARGDYQAWLAELPQFGCSSCADHWETITTRWPICFTNHFAYFSSTCFAHNLVNKRLYKPWQHLRLSISYWSNVYRCETSRELFDEDLYLQR